MSKHKKLTDQELSAEGWNQAGNRWLLKGNNEGALLCYLEAANLGHVDAMSSVSDCYSEKGDRKNADLWAMRAAAFGHPDAIDLLEEDFDPGWHDEFVDSIRASGHITGLPEDAEAAGGGGGGGDAVAEADHHEETNNGGGFFARLFGRAQATPMPTPEPYGDQLPGDHDPSQSLSLFGFGGSH